MKALISPNENNRICEISNDGFDIAEPLFWADCPDDCTTAWTYVDGVFIEPTAPTITAEQNKQTASQLLIDSDWVELPSVIDTTRTPHLTNAEEFLTYRDALRLIAINPTDGDLTWPVKPATVWSK